jgi:hypothetical protein
MIKITIVMYFIITFVAFFLSKFDFEGRKINEIKESKMQQSKV